MVGIDVGDWEEVEEVTDATHRFRTKPEDSIVLWYDTEEESGEEIEFNPINLWYADEHLGGSNREYDFTDYEEEVILPIYFKILTIADEEGDRIYHVNREAKEFSVRYP
ncbi:hypothetical protein [Natrinema versiforme]|uniref:Uncharacterized protein n=1 Tax=Natrinema versiforme TaxID=88724 RepID=A0A4P8WP53_9EURY|nr:hypothetical protein [Natrinema versiforme]QCS43871.1 hypothetical protein FEJ81_16520 [Natrinema versiforme]